MDIDAFRALVTFAQLLWLVLAALLLAAAVALLAKAKARYSLAFAAFACAGLLALVWIVAVRAADSFAMGAVMDVLGPWVLLVAAHIVEPTAWPWVALACSVCGAVLAARAWLRERRSAS